MRCKELGAGRLSAAPRPKTLSFSSIGQDDSQQPLPRRTAQEGCAKRKMILRKWCLENQCRANMMLLGLLGWQRVNKGNTSALCAGPRAPEVKTSYFIRCRCAGWGVRGHCDWRLDPAFVLCRSPREPGVPSEAPSPECCANLPATQERSRQLSSAVRFTCEHASMCYRRPARPPATLADNGVEVANWRSLPAPTVTLRGNAHVRKCNTWASTRTRMHAHIQA